MSRFCPSCNHQVPPNLFVCTYCGKSLTTPKTVEKVDVPWNSSSKQTKKPIIPKYTCLKCLKPLEFIAQYNKWYCTVCNQYDPISQSFPDDAVLHCLNCSELLTYMKEYEKWYCYNCRNYTLELAQFFYQSDEQIQRVYKNIAFCTFNYYSKVLKTSTWEDIGELYVTNRNLFFNGQKFKFKTTNILGVDWAHSRQEFKQVLSKVTGQNYWVSVRFLDSLNLTKFVILGVANDSAPWLDGTKSIEFFNHRQDLLRVFMRPMEKPSSDKTEREIEFDVADVLDDAKQVQAKKIEPGVEIKRSGIQVKSAINYEHAKIIYKIKIENESSSSLGDINVKPFIPHDIFIIDSESKVIPLIRKGESKTITFTLRPKGECGNVNISGNVTYYDTKAEEYHEIRIGEKSTQIVCPMLKTTPLNIESWQNTIGSLISVKENTNEISIAPDELFDIVSDVIKDMNMFMLPPKISKTRRVGRFYAEGIKGFKYGVKIEVLGGLEKSKIILNAYSENQECLIGFYYKILDEIEDRTDIKQYLKEPIIIQGDYISGGQKVEVKDSVLQRSKIGDHSDNNEDSDIEWDDI